MPSISQIFPRARAGLALAGLAVGAAACAPVPYASYSAPDCRPFQQLVTVNGQQQTSYTTQCRMPDGSWRVVAQSNGTASAPATQPQSGTVVPLASNPQGYAYGTLPYDPGFDLSYAGYPYPYAYPYYYSDFYPGYFGPGFAVGFGFNRFAFNRSRFNRFGFNRFGHAGFGNRGQGGFAGGGFHGGGGGFGGGGMGGGGFGGGHR